MDPGDRLDVLLHHDVDAGTTDCRGQPLRDDEFGHHSRMPERRLMPGGHDRHVHRKRELLARDSRPVRQSATAEQSRPVFRTVRHYGSEWSGSEWGARDWSGGEWGAVRKHLAQTIQRRLDEEQLRTRRAR